MSEMGSTAGFGNLGASADDNLRRNGDDEIERLRNLALVPDPPATMFCPTCDFQTEKNSETMSMVCPNCGTKLNEAQINRAIDMDILKRLMGGG